MWIDGLSLLKFEVCCGKGKPSLVELEKGWIGFGKPKLGMLKVMGSKLH